MNGLIVVVAVSLLQGATLWEAAADGGSPADDVSGEGMTRLRAPIGEAGA